MPDLFAQSFRVEPGTTVRLNDFDPRNVGALPIESEARAQTKADAEEIDHLQDRLFAEGRRALLVILQGTDTSGKDGTIRSVFNRTGPLGVSVSAFKRPTEDELAHDYLWRVHDACPKRGTIGVFNRSHYEDVLVPKVRNLVPADELDRRYAQINDFERMLHENGTTILKFMFHISKKEQGERLQARLDDATKRWKFNPGDLEDRARWDEFQAAYETMLARCSTVHAPWHIIPADRKWARNTAVARLVRNTLREMAPEYPKPAWNPADFEVK